MCSIGTTERVSAADAAQIHGTAAHVFDIGDGLADSGLHPGEVVVPAALAVAQDRRSSSRELLEAVLVGYEVMGRVGRCLHPQLTERGICPSGPVGALAAAAASAALMDLSVDSTVQAMGTAALIAPLSTFAWGPSRPLHAGAAAMAGVRAAELARDGVGGGTAVLEDPRGLGALAGVPSAVLRERALADLAPAVARVYFKPFAACRHAHGAIELAQQIREELGPGVARSIDSVEVRTYELAKLLVGRHTAPGAGWAECDTSLPYATAVALMSGDCGPDAMTPRSRALQEVHELASRIQVVADEDFTRRYPERTPTSISLSCRDGSEVQRQLDVRLGDPARPIDPLVLRERFRSWCRRYGATEEGSGAALSLMDGLISSDDVPVAEVVEGLGEILGPVGDPDPSSFP